MLLFIRETIEPKFIRKIICKFLSKYISYFIAVSDTIKDDFISITGKNNITVLYSSVEENLEIYHCSQEEIDPFIKQKDIRSILSHKNLKAVCVGSLNERKNQFLILESLKIIKKIGKKLPLVYFIGDTNVYPKYFKKMMNFIQEEKLDENCYFLGIVEKNIYYKLLPLFDALIISSKSEGLPLVLAEALKFKIPVISTDTGGIKNIIVDNINGILIKNNKNELANAVTRLCDKKFSNELIINGYETYKSKFKLKENMNKLDKICDEIIAR